MTSLSQLAQQALSVVCDVAARDVAVRNEYYRKATATLYPFQKQLLRLEIQNMEAQEDHDDNNNLREVCVDLTSYDAESVEGSALSYTMDANNVIFPYSQLRSLRFCISGVCVNTGSGTEWLYKDHKFVVKDGIVKVQLFYSNAVSLEGKLENYQGRLDDIKDLIKKDRIGLCISLLGRRNTRTGQLMAGFDEPCLHGATFQMEKIQVAKNIVQSALSTVPSSHFFDRNESSNWTSDDDKDQHFEKLAQVNPDHPALATVTGQHKALRAHHKSLVMAQKIYRSACISFEGESFVFDVTDGSLGSVDQPGVWALDTQKLPKSVVLDAKLSSIARMRVSIANIPISHPMGPLIVDRPRLLPDNRTIVINFGGGVEADFVLNDDNTVNDLDPADLLSQIFMTLMAAGNNSVTTASIRTADGQIVTPLDGVTVRLSTLRMRLSVIRDRLNLLGVKC